MTNSVLVFNNAEFGEIRTITESDGTVLFCGRDVAAALGYSNTNKAIGDHCRGVTKRYLTDALGREQEASFIPEGDLYRLICGSKLPSAERFERWVFDEVLPTIRRTGGYKLPSTYIEALEALLETERARQALEAENTKNAPKVLFADSVASSHTDILIGDLAKLLRQNGIDIGQKRLFAWLRDNGYLIKQRGDSWNMPTQQAMEMELFRVKETTINKPDQTAHIARTTKVTGKGQIYFINRFLGKEAA